MGEKVEKYLKDHDTTGIDIEIMPPLKAMRTTCERATAGLNTISVTGNVLRDYLTDLWPILELGTSAKMLSNAKAKTLADALNIAIEKFLDANKNPGRKVKQLDNRGSHFFLAWYWAEALGAQTADNDLAGKFAGIAKDFADAETEICKDLVDCQGAACDIGGYYRPDPAKLEKLMNPSEKLN